MTDGCTSSTVRSQYIFQTTQSSTRVQLLHGGRALFKPGSEQDLGTTSLLFNAALSPIRRRIGTTSTLINVLNEYMRQGRAGANQQPQMEARRFREVQKIGRKAMSREREKLVARVRERSVFRCHVMFGFRCSRRISHIPKSWLGESCWQTL